ncbi:riboflavin synthase [Brachybacterium sp. NPDC056505]|uniref:riboflavin synthase n=1 Tax=Brachybacterium sp. NPDC056505 TaxID=3345843 RepID=UPI00366A729A
MFTGIVEEIGTLETLTPLPGGEARLQLRGPLAASDARLGDSIAVDGVCLTVVDLTGDRRFAVDAVPETLRRTALRDAAPGSRVNLERALRADARLGGHIVQGHVDGIASLRSRRDGGRWVDLVFSIDPALAPLIAEKGAITVSGVSLTVTSAGDDSFGVSLIPATLGATTLGDLAEGGLVNIEVDVLARYVARLQQTGAIGADAPDPTAPEAPDTPDAPDALDAPEAPEPEAARR